jgi:hypothetical protein
MKKLLATVRRLILSFAIVLLIVVLAGYLAWRWWVPIQVDRQLRDQLAAMGFPDATYTMSAFQLDRLTLDDVKLDAAGRLTAKQIDVRASIGQLLAGQVEHLTLTGARWKVNIVDGQIDHGIPDAAMAGESTGGLPIRNLALHNCAVELTHEDHVWVLPIFEPDKAYEPMPVPLALRIEPEQRRIAFRREPLANLKHDPVPALLAHWLPGITIDGAIEVIGHVGFDGAMAGAIYLTGGTITLKEPKAKFEKVAGGFEWVGPRFGTTGRPRFVCRSATIGNLTLGPTTVDFQIQPDQPIFIERLRARLGKAGQLWAHAFEIDPNNVDLHVNLFWENISVGELVSLFTDGQGSGEGRLHGRLPIRIRTQPRLKLAFGQGYLLSETGGVIRIEDEALARKAVQQLPEMGQGLGPDTQQQIEDRFVQALQRFQYKTLRFVVEEVDEQSVLQLELVGQGQANGQVLNLNAKFTGISGLIDVLLRAKLAMAAAQEKIKAGLGRRNPGDGP